MDFSKALANVGTKFQEARVLGNQLAQKKAAETRPSASGTGVHSPGSFGVNADTQPASMRMAGGVGMQKLAATLIHTGVNQYVMPQAEKFMNNIATDIKEGMAKKGKRKAIGGY